MYCKNFGRLKILDCFIFVLVFVPIFLESNVKKPEERFCFLFIDNEKKKALLETLKLALIFFRGGVLEPAGTVEIKYRRKDLVKAMHRLDPKCQEITQALASAGNRRGYFDSVR